MNSLGENLAWILVGIAVPIVTIWIARVVRLLIRSATAYWTMRGSTGGLGVVRGLLRARWSGLWARTPDGFKREYERYQELARRQVPDLTRLAHSLLTYHRDEADYLWPFDDRARAYRTAYHYRLAYEAAELIGDHDTAAQFAHFAGHRFRALDEYQQAADDYRRSASLYQSAPEPNEEGMQRSAKRAIGCLLSVAEFERASEMAEVFGVAISP